MEDAIVNNLHEADVDYSIVVKRMGDIIPDITDDPKERLIYESIITGIERSASEAITNNKIAQLPLIGAIRKNPIKQYLNDNSEHLKSIRKTMTSDEYKTYVRNMIIDYKDKETAENRTKRIIKLVRSRNKKKYDSMFTTIGKGYAEAYIYTRLLFREVPYVAEVQEAYDRLNNI